LRKKARYGERKNAEKSTIWCTKKGKQEHDLVHEEMPEKKRFGGRRNKQNMSWVLLHEEMQKNKDFWCKKWCHKLCFSI